jgi:hypothetical protein
MRQIGRQVFHMNGRIATCRCCKVDLKMKKEPRAMPRDDISPAIANEISTVPSDRLLDIVYFGLKDRSHAVGVTMRSKLIMEGRRRNGKAESGVKPL